MISHKERYVVDEQGKRVGVLLDVEEYHKLLEDLEELEAIRAFDDAKASNDQAIPFEQAIAEIEQARS
jgi:PHD/YefM family antitoxin component YafN of YafNO toxin-antitoxin module